MTVPPHRSRTPAALLRSSERSADLASCCVASRRQRPPPLCSARRQRATPRPPCRNAVLSSSSFPLMCPEPVLAKDLFSFSKKRETNKSCVSAPVAAEPRCCLRRAAAPDVARQRAALPGAGAGVARLAFGLLVPLLARLLLLPQRLSLPCKHTRTPCYPVLSRGMQMHSEITDALRDHTHTHTHT